MSPRDKFTFMSIYLTYPVMIRSVSAFVDTDPKVSDEEMQTLLNWALENSDPGKLKELAADVESGARPDLEDIDYVLKRRKVSS